MVNGKNIAKLGFFKMQNIFFCSLKPTSLAVFLPKYEQTLSQQIMKKFKKEKIMNFKYG